MSDVGVLTVTVNPAIDVSVSVEYLVPDHKLRATEHRRDAGGGGINVSRALRRLGVASRAWVAAGGPTGDELQDLLRGQEGISVVPHHVNGTTRESIALRDEQRDEQYRIVLPGPSLDVAAEMSASIRQAATTVDVVVLSGSLPPGVPARFYADLCDVLDGATTVVDTKGDALAAVMRSRADVVKPSRRELASLVDWVPADRDEILVAARQVLDRGDVGALVVSLGKDGAVLVPRGGSATWYRSPDVDVRSTVGSGDAMVGCIVAQLVRGGDLVEAVRHGVAAGAATVRTPGTELCHPEDVDELLCRVSCVSEHELEREERST